MQRQPDCDTRQVVTATGYTALVGSRILQYEEGKTQILAKDAHSACSGGAAYYLSVDRLGARGTRLTFLAGASYNALVTLRAPALELQGLIALSPLPLFRGIATRAAIPTQPAAARFAMKQERKPSPATPATGLRRPLPKTKTQRESAETRCFCCRSLFELASSRVWGQKPPPPPPQGKPTALAGSGVDELIQQEEEDPVGRVLHSLLPTASPLTALIPATLRPSDS
jgi:hypothetical protein